MPRPAAPTEPMPPRQRRKQARPRELLDAALELFVAKGFAATRAEEVAARAGVSKGTLYLYYPSKEELLKAVIRENLSREIASGQDLVRGFEGPTRELLPRLIHEWWRRIGETPASGICKLMLAEVRNFPDLAQFYQEEVVEPARRMIAGVLERGIARGEFRPVPVRETVQTLMAPVLFMMLHKHSLGACSCTQDAPEPRRLIEVQLDLMLRGLEPRERTAAAAPVARRPRAAK